MPPHASGTGRANQLHGPGIYRGVKTEVDARAPRHVDKLFNRQAPVLAGAIHRVAFAAGTALRRPLRPRRESMRLADHLRPEGGAPARPDRCSGTELRGSGRASSTSSGFGARLQNDGRPHRSSSVIARRRSRLRWTRPSSAFCCNGTARRSLPWRSSNARSSRKPPRKGGQLQLRLDAQRRRPAIESQRCEGWTAVDDALSKSPSPSQAHWSALSASSIDEYANSEFAFGRSAACSASLMYFWH